MDNPQVVMIGAGAMGGVIAGALLRAGTRLSIIDIDTAHVAKINANGLTVDNLEGASGLSVAAMEASEHTGFSDLVIVMTPAYETSTAAETARAVLKPGGSAVSLQNGLGNAESLIEALGADRVFMGSTRCSADRPAPGCPRLTKKDPTTIGELDGTDSARIRWLADALTRGGLPATTTSNITGTLWSKFIHNLCINAPSAITGLRMGEVTRTPGLGALRAEIVAEALAVAEVLGIELEHTDPMAKIAPHVWQKFTKPSMQQHIDAGRPIEIDALNGWLVREADRLGLPAPVNRIMAALARGRAIASAHATHGAPDYEALTAGAEAEIARGERPWEHQEKSK